MSKWLEYFRKLAGTPAGKTVLSAAALLTLALWALVGLAERLTIPWYRAARAAGR
jgi:hypothetical protein